MQIVSFYRCVCCKWCRMRFCCMLPRSAYGSAFIRLCLSLPNWKICFIRAEFVYWFSFSQFEFFVFFFHVIYDCQLLSNSLGVQLFLTHLPSKWIFSFICKLKISTKLLIFCQEPIYLLLIASPANKIADGTWFKQSLNSNIQQPATMDENTKWKLLYDKIQ